MCGCDFHTGWHAPGSHGGLLGATKAMTESLASPQSLPPNGLKYESGRSGRWGPRGLRHRPGGRCPAGAWPHPCEAPACSSRLTHLRVGASSQEWVYFFLQKYFVISVPQVGCSLLREHVPVQGAVEGVTSVPLGMADYTCMCSGREYLPKVCRFEGRAEMRLLLSTVGSCTDGCGLGAA